MEERPRQPNPPREPDDTDALFAIDALRLGPLAEETGEFHPPLDVPTITDCYARGIECIRRREWDSAVGYIRQGLDLDPIRRHSQTVIALANMGFCHDKLEEYDESVAAYTQAIELDPQSEQAFAGLACVYMDLDRPAEALEAGERAAVLRPDNPLTHYNIGNARMALDDFIGAIESYRQAITCQANLFHAWLNMGRARIAPSKELTAPSRVRSGRGPTTRRHT